MSDFSLIFFEWILIAIVSAKLLENVFDYRLDRVLSCTANVPIAAIANELVKFMRQTKITLDFLVRIVL